MIKFTFDVDEIFERLHNKQFGRNIEHSCVTNYDRMITQKELYDRLPSNADDKRYCVLVSIYNAWDDIFDNFDDFVRFVKEQIEIGRPCSKLRMMVNAINRYKHGKLLFCEQDLQNSYRIMCKNVNKNKPVVIIYQYAETKLKNDSTNIYVNHAVTIVGYDEEFIYYKENSEGNYLFNSLLSYVIEYYGKHKSLLDKNSLNHRRILNVFDNLTDKDFVLETMKDVLGYNVSVHGMASLKKEFLTNDQYFYDANQMATHIGDIPIEREFDSINFSFDLDELIERLKKIKVYR